MAYPTFTESFIRVKKKPALKKPVLIVGLPGVGLVSKLAVDHLVKEFKAEKIATLYSPHFPNQVLAMKSGRLRSFTIGFYVKKFKSRDVLFVRGDLQPLTVEGQFEVSAKILEFARQAGCVEAIAMAGYATPEKKAKPAIYCACTDKKLFKQMTSLGAGKAGKIVPIVGMAGILPAMAKLYAIKGCCLLVETPGTPMDAAGAKALLELISKITGQKMVYATLDARVKKAEKLFAKMQPTQSPTLQPPVPEAVERDALRYIR
ncbi:MAG TPA: PAC2 family protein [Candidatus Norongarragalinales archaeon]|nr:PAC2 family protein [Candidatus Norongarragalinales archaeon]